MNPIQLGVAAAINGIKGVSVILATTLIVSGSYVLWDMANDSQDAFTSADMSQYRPAVEEGEPANLEELEKVNSDANAWLTLYSTHIDYPVVQGKNDLEYVNKTVTGETAPTGSIYLATENKRDYSDEVNLMYGHHIDSGAMFGDLHNYIESGYLNSHKKGILITDGNVWDLNVFAAMETDAYDPVIYHPHSQNAATVKAYAQSEAVVYTNPLDGGKILMLSTCDDSRTNGRIVVFATMTTHEGAYQEYLPPDRTPLAGGKGMNYWALLNLLCLIATVYTAVPIHMLLTKLRRQKVMKERNETNSFYREERFSRKIKLGSVIEIVIAIIAVIIFVLTENIHLPIQLIDKYTPIMLCIFALTIITDLYFFRYRELKEETNE